MLIDSSKFSQSNFSEIIDFLSMADDSTIKICGKRIEKLYNIISKVQQELEIYVNMNKNGTKTIEGEILDVE